MSGRKLLELKGVVLSVQRVKENCESKGEHPKVLYCELKRFIVILGYS